MGGNDRRPSGPIPSLQARDRFLSSIAGEVADLRCRLREASLRSEALRTAGLQQAAADVVAEQRAMVRQFAQVLDLRTADATVERAAEAVVRHEARPPRARGCVRGPRRPGA